MPILDADEVRVLVQLDEAAPIVVDVAGAPRPRLELSPRAALALAQQLIAAVRQVTPDL